MVLLIILLLISSYIDIKTNLVDLRLDILILLISIFNIKSISECFLCLLLPISLILINIISKKEVIGYGDIELLFCVSFYLGYKSQVISFFIATLTCFLYSLIKKTSKVAFVPFISFGIIICLLWRLFIWFYISV